MHSSPLTTWITLFICKCVSSALNGALFLRSVFFSEDIASDRGAGAEILQGTALRMPKVPDYESFRRIIDKVRSIFALE